MRRILLVIPWPGSSFFLNDERILSRFYNVEVIVWSELRHPLLETVRLLLRGDYSYCISWFIFPYRTSLITLICRIVGTKSVLIPGGGDIADVESISYGWNRNVVQRILLGFSIKGSDLVLAESECSAREVVAIASPTNMKLVYLSVDTDLFSPHGAKEPIVLTVSRVIDGGNIVRKGLRTFKEVARLLPDYNFLVVGEASGGSCDELAHGASGNLRFLGLVSSEELVSLMRRATVYAQLSKHESFGVATVEAMACGCVPVVTVEGSLPEVAGECGLYADYGNADQTSMAIESAFENRESLGKRARARVLNLFDDHRREKGLIDSLEELETAE